LNPRRRADRRAEPLPQNYYLRPTILVARELIGQLLIRSDEGLTGRIVETEAYLTGDPASHSFRGQTQRNAVMFGHPGRAYVYRIYGLHFCLNCVTGPEGTAEAVLIRAVEPLGGIERMRARRPGVSEDRDRLLTSGPARLCQAFGIDITYDGEILTGGGRITIAAGPGPHAPVETRPRIGISHEAAAIVPWRFVEAGNRFLSRR